MQRKRNILLAFTIICLIFSHNMCLPATAQHSVAEVADWTAFIAVLNDMDSYAGIRLTNDIFAPTVSGDVVISITENTIIDGNGYTLYNVFFVIDNANLEATNLSLITNYENTAQVALLHCITGNATLDSVSIKPQYSPVSQNPSAITGIKLEASASVSLSGCDIYGSCKPNDTTASGGYGIDCEGNLTDLGSNSFTGGDSRAAMRINATDTSLGDCILRGMNGAPALNVKGISSVTLSGTQLISKGPAIKTDSISTVEFISANGISTWPLFDQYPPPIELLNSIANNITLPDTLEMEISDTKQIQAITLPADKFALIFWESDAPDIVHMSDDGKATALKEGSALISALLPGGQHATIAVNVVETGTGNNTKDATGDETLPFTPSIQPQPIAFELSPPEPYSPPRTPVYFYEFIKDEPLYSAPSSFSTQVGTGNSGDFAVISHTSGNWLRVSSNGIEGYVPSSSLAMTTCTREMSAYAAIFVSDQAIYEAPGGDFLENIPAGTYTSSILTRGSWTALLHNGNIVYSPSEGLRLLEIEHSYASVTENGSALYLTPHEDSEVLTRLIGGTQVETLSSPTGDDSSLGWELVKVGYFTGYIPSTHLLR